MNGIVLHNISMLHLLWLLPIVLMVFIYGGLKKKQALELFIEAGLIEKIYISTDYSKKHLKTAVIVLSLASVIFALTRPSWNPKPEKIERKGRDIVFLLDVSKSMLAEDLVPNRLERAKLAIQDCVEQLRGDRVALVAFAGTTALKCPMTHDYNFFLMILEKISHESIARGGTMLGDAMRYVTTDVFDNQLKEYKDIILITDGEDHGSFPVEAAVKSGKNGIRLIAIGIGDESEGRPVPVTNEIGQKTFLKYKNQEVWTKLDAHTLRQMASATPGGRYLNVATGSIDFGDIYKNILATAEKRDLESETIIRYDEKFQIFLAIGLILLCLEMVISDIKRDEKELTDA